MENNQNSSALDYIRQSRSAGISDQNIRQNLLNSGWQNLDVDRVFADPALSTNYSPGVTFTPPSPKKGRVWKVLGIIFIVLVILGVGFGLLVAHAVKQRLAIIQHDNDNTKNAYFVQTGLLRYFSDNQKYPAALQDLIPTYLSSLPVAAGSSTPLTLTYTPSSDGQDYSLCLTIIYTNQQRCASKALVFNSNIAENIPSEFQPYFPLVLKNGVALVELTTGNLSVEKTNKLDTTPSLTVASATVSYEALYAYPFSDNFAKLVLAKSSAGGYSQDNNGIQQNLKSLAQDSGSQVTSESYKGYQYYTVKQISNNKQGIFGATVITIPQDQLTATIYFLSSQSGQAADFIHNLIDSVGEVAFNSDIQQAKSLWSAGSYPDMLVPANQALSLASSDQDKAFAYYWIGVSYFKQNILDQALTNENQAINLYPDFSGPYITRASIYLTENNLQAALADSQKAVQLDPNYAWAHNALGLSYAALGNKTDAITELQKAVALDPNTSLFQLNLTRVKDTMQ